MVLVDAEVLVVTLPVVAVVGAIVVFAVVAAGAVVFAVVAAGDVDFAVVAAVVVAVDDEQTPIFVAPYYKTHFFSQIIRLSKKKIPTKVRVTDVNVGATVPE